MAATITEETEQLTSDLKAAAAVQLSLQDGSSTSGAMYRTTEDSNAAPDTLSGAGKGRMLKLLPV